MKTIFSLFLATVVLLGGCVSLEPCASYDYIIDYTECPPETECYSLTIGDTPYKIIQEKPDLLVVDVWLQAYDVDINDAGLIYSKPQHGVYTRYRAAVMGNYEITERRPRNLAVKGLPQ